MKRKAPAVEVTYQPVPDISYIVSCYNRPEMLPCALWSLMVQTHRNFEVIVADNAEIEQIAIRHQTHVQTIRSAHPDYAARLRYVRTAGKTKVNDCYWSAEWAVQHEARAAWLCFPCDDCYYAPEFGQRMLTAAYANNWDFVYMSQVVVGNEAANRSGSRLWQVYVSKTPKTCFIIRRSVFPGFNAKLEITAPVNADYFLSVELARKNVRMGSVPDIMLLHN